MLILIIIFIVYTAPFIKCEATKYTEVGIVGQSAEESVKDLVDKSIKMERAYREYIVDRFLQYILMISTNYYMQQVIMDQVNVAFIMNQLVDTQN